MNVLPKWTFEGLYSLEELIIRNATIHNCSDGIFDFVKNTLRSFSLIEQNESYSISISSFIGQNSASLTNIEYVKIQYNLDTIDHTSLAAISFVKVLDLSDCYIRSIGEHSFDNLGSNLQLLNLERNMLTSLPTDLFSQLHLNSAIHAGNVNLKIRLIDNLWHCDYLLAYVKHLLVNYTNFDDDMLCVSPEEQNGTQIKNAELCTICTTSEPTDTTPQTTCTTTETTTAFTDTITTPEPEATTTTCTNDDDNELPTKECHGSHNKVSILSQTHDMLLSLRSAEIYVKLETYRSDMVLMWFGTELITDDMLMYQQGEIIDCVANLSSEIAVNMNNLQEGVTYTLCLLGSADTTVSPLNCLSYHHQEMQREYNSIWVYKSSKSLIISLIFASLIATVVAGFIIGAFSMKHALSHGTKISFDFELLFASPKRTNTTDTVNESVDSFR